MRLAQIFDEPVALSVWSMCLRTMPEWQRMRSIGRKLGSWERHDTSFLAVDSEEEMKILANEDRTRSTAIYSSRTSVVLVLVLRIPSTRPLISCMVQLGHEQLRWLYFLSQFFTVSFKMPVVHTFTFCRCPGWLYSDLKGFLLWCGTPTDGTASPRVSGKYTL